MYLLIPLAKEVKLAMALPDAVPVTFAELCAGAFPASARMHDYELLHIPYMVLIVVESATLTSFGPVRTNLPCRSCSTIIVVCMSPFQEWYVIHARDHLASKGPGTLRRGSEDRAYVIKANKPKATMD
jgi:hypothetical protein